MKELMTICFLSAAFMYGVTQFGLWDQFKQRAEVVHNYEYKALELAQKLRIMQRENYDLKAEIAKIKAEKEHIMMTSTRGEGSRSIASIRMPSKNDLVKFDVYKWAPEKLYGVGSKELHFKNFEKSAQFYKVLTDRYPEYAGINDKVLFEAGIAAFESKNHYDWAQSHFKHLVSKYPSSKYRRGAKLWLALSHYYQGDKAEFMATVEEFRLKYRNTKEWKLLSKYYEDLAYKHKK